MLYSIFSTQQSVFLSCSKVFWCHTSFCHLCRQLLLCPVGLVYILYGEVLNKQINNKQTTKHTHTNTHTHKQTNKQTNKQQTNKQTTNKQTNKQQTNKQTNKYTVYSAKLRQLVPRDLSQLRGVYCNIIYIYNINILTPI